MSRYKGRLLGGPSDGLEVDLDRLEPVVRAFSPPPDFFTVCDARSPVPTADLLLKVDLYVLERPSHPGC